MLALLGWNPGTAQELFSLDELTQVFTLERVSKAGAKFDPDKTKWFQQQYLRQQSNSELVDTLNTLCEGKYSKEQLTVVCDLMKERATFVADMLIDGSYLVEKPLRFDEETIAKKWKPETTFIMQEWKEVVTNLSQFDADAIESAFKNFLAEKELGIGAVLLPFRLTITGVGAGPGMFDIASFLGKEEVLDRMEEGLKRIISLTHA